MVATLKEHTVTYCTRIVLNMSKYFEDIYLDKR